MDCKTARLLLDLSRGRPAELDTDEAGALDAHVQDCRDCQTVDRGERLFDDRLAAAMQSVPVPIDLRQRLAQTLNVRRRARLRRQVLAAAAAVLIFLVVGSGSWAWVMAHPIVIDPDALVEEAGEQQGISADQVDQRFAELGFRTSVPRDWNYAYLVSYRVQEFKGRRVPALHFVRGTNWAEVLVLDLRHFQIKGSNADSGGIAIEIRLDPNDSRRGYLVKYTGGSLDWLLLDAQPAGLG
jgi:hypothetical protein